MAVAVSFISPVAQQAGAATTTTTTAPTTTTTAVPGSNCAAAESGFTLDRKGWTASSNAPSSSADAPANALDGNYSSRFSTTEDQMAGLDFEVDLGSAFHFNELEMSTPESPNDYAHGFNVYVSNNGSSWTKVASCTGSSTPEVVSFSPQDAEYVKIVLDASANVWWSIDEFHLYSPTTQPTTTTTAPTTTTTAVPGSNCSAAESGFTLDRTAWAASSNAPSSSTDAAANALDGDYSSRFSTNEDQTAGLYFEVNLGSADAFNELKMSTPGSPNDYAHGFDAYVSTDGSAWTKVASCTGTSTPEVVSFSPQDAKYVKIVLNASANVWWSIDEFNLYNPTAQPTTTTTTTVPPTTTTVPPTTTTVPPTTTTTVPPTTRTTVPPFRYRGQRCVRSWPRSLVHGSLIVTRHGFFAVISPCYVRVVVAARVLVAYHVKRHGHVRTMYRWAQNFRLGSAMDRRLVELKVARGDWLRWNGRLYFVKNLSLLS
jgi:hypothetical protein